MIDFLSESRRTMIDNFQISLKAIRTLMGYSGSELADFIGVTRQTKNNLETGQAKMSPSQSIAIAAVVDNYILSNGKMFNAIEMIIDGNGNKQDEKYDTSFSNLSLLKRWFAYFNDGEDLNTLSMSYGSTEEYGSLLQKMVARYKIFVDADVLLTPNSSNFLNMLADFLVAENARIIIPIRVIEQIQEMMQDINVSGKAVRALKLLNSLQGKDVVQLRGEESDTNIHDTIISVFAKFRSLHRLCLVTQNESFADEVNRLNENSENQGFDILVGYVDESGKLALYQKQGELLSEVYSLIEEDENASYISKMTEEFNTNKGSGDVDVEIGHNLTEWSQL